MIVQYLPARGRTRRALTALAALVTLAVAAAPAGAAVRYAAPGATDTVSSCDPGPCEIGHAVGAAQGGDTVLLAGGRYDVSASVTPSADIHITAADPSQPPTIVGDGVMLGSVLELDVASSLSHVRVESYSTATALAVQDGASASHVVAVVHSVVGDSKAIQLKNGSNLLTDSLAISHATAGAGLQIKDGTNTVIGVTAIGAGGSSGLTTKIMAGSGTVKNSILLGASDVDYGGGNQAQMSYTNWRPGNSTGGVGGTGDRSNAPAFCAYRPGDYYPAPGSPTIDAGSADALSTHDLGQVLRSLGGAPDAGAYEFDAAKCVEPPPPSTDAGPGGTTDTNGTDATGGSGEGTSGGDAAVLPPATEPVLGTTVSLGEVSGTPLVRLPGSNTFVPLTHATTIPVGAIVDTTNGRVELTSVRDASGRTQTGTFWGGVFQVRQSRRDTVTELALTGSSFSRCPAARTRGKLAASRTSRHSSRVRRLWGRDRGGRFRTRGRHGSATVRGTRWLTEDRCNGTLFKVAEGAIDVRDNRRRKTVRLKRGGSYLAAAPAAKKRRK